MRGSRAEERPMIATAIDNADERLLSIRVISLLLRFFIRVSSENSNYLYCRDDRKGPDYVTFSYRITPDACSSLCLRLSDPTSAPEPLPGIRKERRQERKGVAGREESVRWRFEGGNELPASTTLVMTWLPCLSLSSLRRSFPRVIPRQWSHLKPPARRQNDSLDSLLNEILHFPILLNFPKIEALYFSFTLKCNTLPNEWTFISSKNLARRFSCLLRGQVSPPPSLSLSLSLSLPFSFCLPFVELYQDSLISRHNYSPSSSFP